jgi:hypothetical protein|tara:strand:- start:3107 stop:3235 length:129 start_codon:yes stop_codon:yes gene_type:complete
MKKKKLNSKNPKYYKHIKDNKPKIKERKPIGNTGKVFAVFYE